MAYGHCPYDVGRRSRDVVNVSRQPHPTLERYMSRTIRYAVLSLAVAATDCMLELGYRTDRRPKCTSEVHRTRRSRACRWTLSILRCKRESAAIRLGLERFERLDHLQRRVAQRSLRTRYALAESQVSPSVRSPARFRRIHSCAPAHAREAGTPPRARRRRRCRTRQYSELSTPALSYGSAVADERVLRHTRDRGDELRSRRRVADATAAPPSTAGGNAWSRVRDERCEKPSQRCPRRDPRPGSPAIG